MKKKSMIEELKSIKSTLSEGEKISIDTLVELSDNKGDDEDE